MKIYNAPELEVIVFESEDIITSSGLAVEEGDNNVNVPGSWLD